jgi:hypothetical protein
MSSRHPASSEIRPDPERAGTYLVGGELGFATVPTLLERGREAQMHPWSSTSAGSPVSTAPASHS